MAVLRVVCQNVFFNVTLPHTRHSYGLALSRGAWMVWSTDRLFRTDLTGLWDLLTWGDFDAWADVPGRDCTVTLDCTDIADWTDWTDLADWADFVDIIDLVDLRDWSLRMLSLSESSGGEGKGDNVLSGIRFFLGRKRDEMDWESTVTKISIKTSWLCLIELNIEHFRCHKISKLDEIIFENQMDTRRWALRRRGGTGIAVVAGGYLRCVGLDWIFFGIRWARDDGGSPRFNRGSDIIGRITCFFNNRCLRCARN